MKKTLLSTLLVLAIVLLGFGVSYARGLTPTAVPEPATWLLLGTGVAGIAVAGVIKKRKKK